MVTLDLADTLVIEEQALGLTRRPGHRRRPVRARAGLADPGAIPVGAGQPGGPGPGGRRAATARVHMVKRIPPGAGLGGGSADAAAVLRWAGCTDLDVAAALGADVPFCLAGGRAMVRGVGEAVDAAALRGSPVRPAAGSLRGRHRRRLPGLGRSWPRAGGGARPADGSANDLEAAALKVEPRLARAWRARLEAAHRPAAPPGRKRLDLVRRRIPASWASAAGVDGAGRRRGAWSAARRSPASWG